MRRYHSIDILRTVAIVVMIETHFVDNLSVAMTTWPRLLGAAERIGMSAAPLFTLLSGMSLSLSMAKLRALGRTDKEMDRYCLRRGLFLFAFGIAFAFVIWSPRYTFDWDILTLLGASTLIMIPLRRVRPRVLIGICVAVLLVSPPLRELAHYDSHWAGSEYSYENTVSDISLGFLLNAYFPLLPWVVFPIAGYALGAILPHEGSEGEDTTWPSELAVISAGMLFLAWVGTVVQTHAPGHFAEYYASELNFYPASTTFILGMMGLSVLALWALHRWVDQNTGVDGKGRVLTFCTRYSRFALTAYVVHHAVHIWPLYILAKVKHQPALSYYLGSATDTPLALALAGVFVLLFYLAIPILERRSKFSFEGLMRWVTSARPVAPSSVRPVEPFGVK